MSPYFFAAIARAASESKRRRNGHKSSTAVRRHVASRPSPHRNSRTTSPERRFLSVRVTIEIALMIAFIVGLTLFSFAN